ncbi:hypothetical protein CPB83DRAFT_836316 [Crepidotus variabilis]|uniref:RRM domain-containing protein n=1 Tax=Crepidotus variabilis TaxID=179855 RepID=A0A9P6JPH9_9AGAR|nr:hypothetical protein CPB83DRAFT_836316 [Crepidotus variabilis]
MFTSATPHLRKIKSISLILKKLQSLQDALPLQMDELPYTTPDEDPFSARSYLQEVQEQKATLKCKRSSMFEKWIQEQQQAQVEPQLAAVAVQPESEILEPPSPFYARSAPGSSSNPYLAYPDIPRTPSKVNLRADRDDTQSIASYVVIQGDEIPPNDMLTQPESPVTPSRIRRRTHKHSKSSLTPASFRTLNFTLRSSSNSPSPAQPLPSHSTPQSAPPADMEAFSRTLSRLSIFPRTPRSSTVQASTSSSTTPQPQHGRSSSLASNLTQSTSTFYPPSPSRSQEPKPNQAIRFSTPSKWRPSVLGHFHHQPSASQSSITVSEAQSSPSRPSISSSTGETYSASNATTTTLESSSIQGSVSKISLFDSIRLRSHTNRSTRTISSILSSSQATDVKHELSKMDEEAEDSTSSSHGKQKSTARKPLSPKSGSQLDNIDDEDDLDDYQPTRTFRGGNGAASSTRPPIHYSSNSTLTRVKFASIGSRSQRKRKKLIISGIGASEARKFEGVKRWCESFGDIRSINRMPNGDLMIDFRDPEVADTVCRIRAKVFIAGVGSVQLSWVIGNKRS